MTPLARASFPLAALALLARVGIPLWMTVPRPGSSLTSRRRAYFRAATAGTSGVSVIMVPSARRH
jgi:hypothetical protein